MRAANVAAQAARAAGLLRCAARWASMVLVVLVAGSPARAETDASAALRTGIAQRQQGQLTLSINTLQRALDSARTPAEAMPISAELGASLLEARRLDAAEAALQPAYALLTGAARSAVALDLGNLAVMRGQTADAQRYYAEALALGAGEPRIGLSARLNQLRLLPRDTPVATRQATLTALTQAVAAQPATPAKARWQINLAAQWLLAGPAGVPAAFAQLDAARRWAATAGPGQARWLAEAQDALAQLYEEQQRTAEALTLTRQALATAQGLPPGAAGDLGIQLEWRQARLSRSLGRPGEALAAFERAVRHIEALRQDMPIEDEAGGSSFRATLQPVYLGLVEALLDAADTAPPGQRSRQLRQAVDTVELIRQSELQDYLGDRCEVDAVKGGSATVIPRGTAVLYPVVLADRLDLLLETAEGITRQRAPVAAQRVRDTATAFAAELRNGTPGFMAPARQLYDWVLRPLEATLAAQGIDTLVVAPDGALRLVAIGAFHDGQRFAIEKYAIATTTGMTMTNTTPPGGAALSLLVAGMSEPGPVVDKLTPATVARLLGADPGGTAGGGTALAGQSLPSPLADAPVVVASRSVRASSASRALRTMSSLPGDAASRTRALREALALPGVDQEVAAIGRIVPGRQLLNASFTVDGFRRAAESGDYRVIHVASHGVFGGSADASYILAYDDLLTLDGLQTLLKSDEFRRNPIELLSLSACETAEGDDRSPLGISGAAMKARAKAVLGSLWPVADEPAVQLMTQFYRGLQAAGNAPLSKAQALQRSQIALLRAPDTAHPFYWAPFILIGNWL